jgi:hypothetical protein
MLCETHVSSPVTTSITCSLLIICGTHLAQMFCSGYAPQQFLESANEKFPTKRLLIPVNLEVVRFVDLRKCYAQRCLFSRRPAYLNRGYKLHRGITRRRVMTRQMWKRRASGSSRREKLVLMTRSGVLEKPLSNSPHTNSLLRAR